MENVTADFTEIKNKQISTGYTIAYVTTRLLTAKLLIQEASRQWKDGRIYSPFLDFMNISLSCGDDCPLKYATPRKCALSENRKMLFMDFNSPMINKTMQLLEADPFQFMLQHNNKTCSVTYNGPTSMVVSSVRDCAVDLNIRRPSSSELLLAPGHDCLNMPEINKRKYFTVTSCNDQNEFDAANFVQIKPYGNNILIYCNGNQLTFSGKQDPCPDEVFQLPVTATFQINKMEYTGSKLYVDHVENVDPLFNIKINWHMKPEINLTDLKTHPLVVSDLPNFDESKESNYTTHPSTWTTIGLLGIILLAGVGYGIYHFKYKQAGTGTRIQARRVGSTIELQEVQG